VTRTLSPLFTWRSAIADSELQPTVRHVALTLSLHMGERGDHAWPSIGTLCAETGLHRATVFRALRALEDDGWLARRSGGGKASNTYSAQVPDLPVPQDDRSHSATGNRSHTATTPVAHSDGTGRVVRPKDVNERDNERDNTSGDHEHDEAHRDLIFEAFCETTAVEWRDLTKTRAKAIGSMAATLRRLGADPDEIRRRAANYHATFTTPLTPETLMRRWAELGAARPTTNGNGSKANGNGHHADEQPTLAAKVWAANIGKSLPELMELTRKAYLEEGGTDGEDVEAGSGVAGIDA
jgi:hypothetical protein